MRRDIFICYMRRMQAWNEKQTGDQELLYFMANKGKKRKPKAPLLFAVVLAACMLAGCGRSRPMASEIKDDRRYTDAQIMLVVATEKNRYSQVYTDQIWQVQINDGVLPLKIICWGRCGIFSGN